jgi:transposase
MTGRTRRGSAAGRSTAKSSTAATKTQRAPTLPKGGAVILKNLTAHKSPKAAAILKEIGARFLFLPPYSPDRNGIFQTQSPDPKGRRLHL